MTESGFHRLTPDGKIIATDTLSLAFGSVHVMTMFDIPHVNVGGEATEVSDLTDAEFEEPPNSDGGFFIATAVAHGGVVVGVGKGRPRT